MSVNKEEFGGLSSELARMMGFGRARAIAIKKRANEGKSIPTDPIITDDDFKCDAEQVGVDKDGVVRKSSKPR